MEHEADDGAAEAWRGEQARLAQFLEEMLSDLGRRERRHWGAV